ncbi:MAG: hypothetical protein ABJ042_16765, partial [Lentilitoribacter sp.]
DRIHCFVNMLQLFYFLFRVVFKTKITHHEIGPNLHGPEQAISMHTIECWLPLHPALTLSRTAPIVSGHA